MAVATVTPTVNNYPTGVDMGLNKGRIFGTIAISGAGNGTYQTNGLPISFSGLVAGLSGSTVMAWFNSLAGLFYAYDPVHGTFRIYSAFGTELGNGATVTTTYTNDTIEFEATVNKV
jgi:hypothetical protein